MFTNRHNIPLPLAVWLAADSGYDMVPAENKISGTTLQAPIKSIILQNRLANSDLVDTDIVDILDSKMGTAFHSAMEQAWLSEPRKALALLGYPQKFIDSVVVNPEQVTEGMFPVYVEKRTEKAIGSFIISGKFDMVVNGELHDLKSTKTYSYITQNSADDYIKQGSIYRWLNPDIITSDILTINYLFKDWKQYEAERSSDYPQSPALGKTYPLMSIEETEAYILSRLNQVEQYYYADQDDIPDCQQEELWPEETVWAYYKKPTNKRATKIFDNEAEAIHRLVVDGSVGMVQKRLGEVKRCHYCSAKNICIQADQLKADGLLK